MSMDILIQPLTQADFAPFGDVIDTNGAPDKIINQGLCGRYHDRATLSFENGQAGVSLFQAKPRSLPYDLTMMERHPLGSQCFIPMSQHPFLVIVAHDAEGQPAHLRAFMSEIGQAINFHKNTWHGVLTPLHDPGLFAVVDLITADTNLEEHWFDTPYRVRAP
ncbi:MAG: ureidoglycolate lyase [Halocynthiibacter sp.]